jgi:hypothetical protein
MEQCNVNETSPVAFVKACVKPGQKVTKGPFTPWLLLDKKHGYVYVMCSHCTCMAGLGEACSHIAAMLFAIESATFSEARNQTAPTSVKYAWNKYHKQEVNQKY